MARVVPFLRDRFPTDLCESHIATVDADGVVLAAIQSLAERLDETAAALAEKDDCIAELEAEAE